MPQPPFKTITSSDAPSFGLSMTDDALVTFTGPPNAEGATPFVDQGFMPINQVTIGGIPQDVHGKYDGLFIHYFALGTQSISANGLPSVDYSSLDYEVYGYKGDATFGHASDGTPTESGATHLDVLAQGSMIPGTGHLQFNPDGTIKGNVDATYTVGGQQTGTLDLLISHAAADLSPTANGFTLKGGDLQATFIPAHG